MLLVDHHQAELGERHVLLDDRLGADHQIDLSGGDQLQQGRPLCGRQAAGQLGAADLAGGQHAFERQGVLPGENFRGGHQHGLVSVGHRQQHGVDGHHGLAAAHVALQEPVHGQRAGHVGGDLGDRPLLARGQLEGEEAADAGVDLGRGLQGRGLPLVVLLLPLDGQRQLQNQQLLIHQPPPGAVQTLLVGGKMDLRQRLAERPEVVGLQIFVGKDFVEHAGVRLRAPRGRSSASAIAAALRSADRRAESS